MEVKGKLISQTAIKCDGNMFHELLHYRTNELSKISPHIVKSVELCKGHWGCVGSITSWNFILDGKSIAAKELIEAQDEEKKSFTYNVVEGDIKELYKSFKLTISIVVIGEKSLVTVTFEYEKMSEVIPEPHALMDICVVLVKDIECHLMLVPN